MNLPLKTFQQFFGKKPLDIFDSFSKNAVHAASIGQVHKATLGDKVFAVKIQYPGIRESIGSDIALVKPIAVRMFNLQGTSDEYFQEVEEKLTEETDYKLEISQSMKVIEDCEKIDNLLFPKYYPEYSSDKIITMDWMNGIHLSEFCSSNASQEQRNKVGQTLWNFYMYQIHQLKKFHADPHPGNFLVDENDNLIAIDFGCMKEIPNDFYVPYFEVSTKESLNDMDYFTKKLYELEILKSSDTPRELDFFTNLFHDLLSVFTQPIQAVVFDFAQPEFQTQIAVLSEKFSSDKTLRKMNGNRGSKHFIYVNRTFFGLYSLMAEIKAKVIVNDFEKYLN